MGVSQDRMSRLWLRILPLVGASIPQITGLVAQIIIIKLISVPEVAFRLPTYNFAISVTSIIFLGLAYRQTRFVPSLQHILGLQGAVLTFSLFFFLNEGWQGYLIAGLCVSVLASVSIILLQMLSGFTRSRYLIGATILSAAAPNILWLDMLGVFAITCTLLSASIALTMNTFNKNEDFKNEFTQSLYSVLLQIPMLSLTLFDPLISKIMGLENYLDYSIILKITNGVFLLLFSKMQLDVIKNDKFDIDLKFFSYLSFLLLIFIIINSFFYGIISVFIQCCILSFLINIVSIVVRVHLRFDKIRPKFAIFSVSTTFIYSVLTFGMFFGDIYFENYAAVIAAFIVVGSLPILWHSFGGKYLNARGTDF
jgi:hypothetical protein